MKRERRGEGKDAQRQSNKYSTGPDTVLTGVYCYNTGMRVNITMYHTVLYIQHTFSPPDEAGCLSIFASPSKIRK